MKKAIIWIGALIVGAILGLFGIAWLDEVMNFVATVYTRLFQLLAVPTIVLAVITTFATFGSKGSGRIFGHTLTYTLQSARRDHQQWYSALRNQPSDILHRPYHQRHSQQCCQTVLRRQRTLATLAGLCHRHRTVEVT